MTWKDIAGVVGKIAPILGTLLGGPIGAAAGGLISAALGCSNTPDAVSTAIATDPQAAIKLAQIASDERVATLKLANDAAIADREEDTKQISAVNTTMQSEAANAQNESGFQKGWRPFNGYIVGITSLITVIGVCLLFWQAIILKDLTGMTILPQMVTSIAMILAIPGAAVGITAWHKGVAEKSNGN